jgi:hypothetical protein
MDSGIKPLNRNHDHRLSHARGDGAKLLPFFFATSMVFPTHGGMVRLRALEASKKKQARYS